mmetsp:Transcript_8074/g.18596  ORF Transcript_8074/g.18596 Transcript_8074/m.18596 type:complete len:226 (-) Transcript_8074:148-825(-)
MLDVHGVHVAHLPPEELENVHHLGDGADEHGVGDVAVELVLLRRVRHHRHAPEHHPPSAVGEELQVPAQAPQPVSDARIQLGAPEKVKHKGPCGAGVGGGGEVDALEVEEEGEEHAEDVHACNHTPKDVVEDARVPESSSGARSPEHDGRQEARGPVRLVRRHVPGGGDGAFVVGSGDERHEDKLDSHEEERAGQAALDLLERGKGVDEGADRSLFHDHLKPLQP